MRQRLHSKLIDFGPNEFIDKSLIPSAVMRRAYESIDAHMTHQYWNMLGRIPDKKVTFEQLQVFVNIMEQEATYPDDSQMLVQTKISTARDQGMIQYEADIYKAIHPFTQVAAYRANAKEFQYADPEKALFAVPSSNEQLNSEIKDLAPPGVQIEELQGFNGKLRKLRLSGEWLGPVETKHFAIADYCQYAQLSVFLCYAGPVTYYGKYATVDWLKKHHSREMAHDLAKKIDFRGWKMWLNLLGTFYLNQKFYVHTYFMKIENSCYLKHEIYCEQPDTLVNIILEQYD